MSTYGSSFNARYSSPKEIAKSFVTPYGFDKIVEFSNMVLVGPRGIGKTTILKVITASGLHHLSKRNSSVNYNIDYVPIYIPAEKMWKGNAEAITAAGYSPELESEILNGLFVNHCLYHLVASIQDCRKIAQFYNENNRPSWVVDIAPEQEIEICRLCSELWSLDNIQTSFLGLKLSLVKRTNQFCSIVNSLDENASMPQIEKIPKLDILLMLRGFFDILEEFIGIKKWSLNFDEMEIAPIKLIRVLFENLRSFDQRAVLKFSLFPYVEFYDLMSSQGYGADSPGPGNDFISINLANSFTQTNKASNRAFPLDIASAICAAKGSDLKSVKSYLNASSSIKSNTRKFETDRFRRDHDGIFNNSIKEKTDKAFIQYLSNNGVANLDDLHSLGAKKRDSLIRKVFPIAEIRQYYLRDKPSVNDGVYRRSIKGYGYYHGFDQIMSLTEDNPRAIYLYFNEIASSMKNDLASAAAQNKIIRTNVDRFRAFIATQAIPHASNLGKLRNTLNVVDRLGTNISLALFSESFRPEPALSFMFKDLDESSRAIIGIAINSGAIVPDRTPDDSNLIFNLIGLRLRVSHRLAPFYPLPTITSKPKKLSKIPSSTGGDESSPDLLSYGLIDD